MIFSRSDRSRLAEWWFTVDRRLLSAILLLIAIGLLLSVAASPAIAMKRGFATYHFVVRHAAFASVGFVVLMAVSFLSPQQIRRLALVTFALAIAGMIAVLLTGAELNGAKRWLSIAGHSIQPSEFAKPGFIVVSAWLFSETKRRPEMPALTMAFGLAAVMGGLLIAQPDIGQTMLVLTVWGTLYVASGQPWMGALALVGLAIGGAGAAYLSFSHVQSRVDRYLSGTSGDHSQMDRAMQAFTEGGFYGRGPGEGTIKIVLPDAHTDFIFAVVAEEYGVLACLVLLALFAFVAVRAVLRAGNEGDQGNRLAILGLAMVFSLQALINMGVNAGLLPAKGMTLPLISAGGSSMVAVCLTLGMLLSLTRKRTDLANLKKPRMVATRRERGDVRAQPQEQT
jgi:cell division protein FtsW